MALETATYISDLVAANPVSGDPKSQGDDHIRLLKSTIKATFPNINAPLTATDEELNFVDGVTSNIQTQLDLKAPLASPALTGTPTAPTADTGTSGTQIATLDFVIATSTAASLPGQTGKGGQIMTTDGTDADWSASVDISVMKPNVGTDFATTTGTQTISGKTYKDPVFADGVSDPTKQLAWNLTRIGTATQRVVDVYDEDVLFFTPYARLLSTVTVTNAASVDLEHAFNNTYDMYFIEGYNIGLASASLSLAFRAKKGGSYLAGTAYNYRTDSGNSISGQPYVVCFSNTGGGAPETAFIRITIPIPYDTTRSTLFQISGANTDYSLTAYPVGVCVTTGALQGIRFMTTGGNILTGTFKLFGVRKT